METIKHSFWGKSSLKWWFVAIAVILGVVFWYGRGKENQKAVRYETVAVEKGMLISSITASGNVMVDQIANVDPTISGTVENLSVKAGDSVKKGDLLFYIKNDQLGVNAAKARASYEKAIKSMDDAKYSKKLAEAEYDKNSKKINKDKVELAKDAIVIAERDVAVARADYVNQLADANERKVLSPIDGTVSEINIKNGDDLAKISSGTSKLTPIIIGDLDTLKVQVEVNEVDISKIEIDQKVMLKLDAIEGLELSGRVEKIASLGAITQGVVTYDVTIGFDVIDPRIKPQMSVSASIISSAKQDALLVPSAAVKLENGKNYVEVLKNQLPEKVSVELGSSNDLNAEILSGVSPGELVVTQTIDADSNSSSDKKQSSTQSGGAIRMPGMGGFR